MCVSIICSNKVGAFRSLYIFWAQTQLSGTFSSAFRSRISSNMLPSKALGVSTSPQGSIVWDPSIWNQATQPTNKHRPSILESRLSRCSSTAKHSRKLGCFFLAQKTTYRINLSISYQSCIEHNLPNTMNFCLQPLRRLYSPFQPQNEGPLEVVNDPFCPWWRRTTEGGLWDRFLAPVARWWGFQ